MPFTFAHPAAVLPFTKSKKYFYLPAMILGSMAPDFEYLLRGRPYGIYGHTLWGMIAFDLPIVIIVFLIWKYIIWSAIESYMPQFLKEGNTYKWCSKIRFVATFCYSAIIGIATHVIWDSFTHKEGEIVKRIAMLNKVVAIGNYEIPVYKVLQHGSTLIGFGIMFCLLLTSYKHRDKTQNESVETKTKYLFWSGAILVSLLVFMGWYFIKRISINNYGALVIRMIDSGFISLLILSLILKIKNEAQYKG